jgi:tripartite-type tricarboxylate transporter receptor subunit TctC
MGMKNIAQVARAVALACLAAPVMDAARAQDYPMGPVRIISGFSPGSTADITARVVGAKMGQILGQQFVIENRTGAASSIAGAMVARAPKDGYTLYVANAANMINAAMNPNLNFDIIKDFTPITLLTSTPTVLVVSPQLGVKSVKQLVALAKAKPDTITFGSSGVASSTHLALELLKSLAQVKITHIPYAGSPQVITDLLAGRIHGYFSPASAAMEHVRAGTLIVLAVTDAERSTFMPDLPTMIEAGIPGFESILWFGLVAPVDTPAPVIDKLARAANEALKSEEVAKALHAQTVAPIGGTPEEFRQYMETERKRWSAVVASEGLQK